MAKLLDGKILSEILRKNLKETLASEIPKRSRSPKLSHVLATHDAATLNYARSKAKACEELGIQHELINLFGDTQSSYLKTLDKLNHDPSVDAILPQLPLDPGFDLYSILQNLKPSKDVDGLTPQNLGQLLWKKDGIIPCTPGGILALLDHAQINISGLKATVIGRSLLVGRTLSFLLEQRGATVTTIHTKTKRPEKICQESDLLVSAAGVPGLVQGDWIKPGAIVVDVGINRNATGTLVGDVEPEAAEHLASYRTPVPGGVGPMTVTMLLHNIVKLYLRKQV